MLNPITDLSSIAEQLCRIEHKIDLIVEYLAQSDGKFSLRLISDKTHRDPLTQEQVDYYMDLFKRHVVRKSSDGTGLYPPSFVLFTPNSANTGNANNGGESGSNG